MDPDATLRCIVECIKSRNFDEADSLAEDLREWIARGGFPPCLVDVEPYVAHFLASYALGDFAIG